MLQINTIFPKYHLGAFNCPICKAYSKQDWQSMHSQNRGQIKNMYLSFCTHCGDYSTWKDGIMLHPQTSFVPLPNQDLSKEIRETYLEASAILNQSPRGASALLRLCIQLLCKELGESGKNINEDIKSLVSKGLSPLIQQALDLVRVIGNNAVHPGQLDMKDNVEVATKLFTLINVIADVMITTPKHIRETYESLVPQKIKDEIKKRDGN